MSFNKLDLQRGTVTSEYSKKQKNISAVEIYQQPDTEKSGIKNRHLKTKTDIIS
jgi:hypothetical protein